MIILWLFHFALLILDHFVFQKIANLTIRGKGYYIILQSFAANSILFLLGKYLDDNADLLFELASKFSAHLYELASFYVNNALIWNEIWFYVSGSLCFIMSEKHLNFQYSWIAAMIGISNTASFFFIESSCYILLYAATLGVFIINKWRYEYDFKEICFYDYLIVFHTLLLLIGSYFALKFALKEYVYIEIGTEIMSVLNIIAQIYWINFIGFYLWKILRAVMKYEMYLGIILIFWLHVICGIITFGDVLHRKAVSFKERNNKSELKKNKDIFKIIWLYFLMLIVLATIPISKFITILIIGSTNFILDNLFYFLWVWQIGFILEFPDSNMDQFPECFFKNIYGIMVYGVLGMKVLGMLFD
ncbi:unnamed protein product [Blepharisma stoltei]|uniref:Uncharacterized protein n=1 Tax=Blepharisma stoltei TaxID=1481888 RepID=A0AAU9ICU6_9CILI|nr:unnamed protein product [Blepharisma stoltei]